MPPANPSASSFRSSFGRPSFGPNPRSSGPTSQPADRFPSMQAVPPIRRADSSPIVGTSATARPQTGPLVRHDYAAPGRYMARLEVLGSSTKVGDGAATDFEVVVRTPPDARIVAPISAPVGADVTFDGSGSVDGDMPIRTLTWHFNDGAVLAGRDGQQNIRQAGPLSRRPDGRRRLRPALRRRHDGSLDPSECAAGRGPGSRPPGLRRRERRFRRHAVLRP